MFETALHPGLRDATTSSLVLLGIAVACVCLFFGIILGRRLRARKALEAQWTTDDSSDDALAADDSIDHLTKLANHRAFDDQLLRQIDEFQWRQTPLCLLMVDVDHFKQFDDIHNHLAGDDVLRMVARKLRTTVRNADIIARYRGEEFGVIMPKSRLTEGLQCAQRVRTTIEQAICEFGGRKLKVTVSIGIAELTAGQTPATLMRCADEALYAAKQAGCNQVQCYCPPSPTPPKKPLASPSSHHSPESIRGSIAADKFTSRSRTDSQTGLPNRIAFCEEIHRRLSEAQRHGNRLSLMLVRVDNLAEITESMNPVDTDTVVRSCAQFFTAAMRDMDLVVRYDADVFGITLPSASLMNAVGVGHRLRTAVGQCPLRLKDQEIRFTLSAGVSEAQPGEELSALLHRTEEAKNMATIESDNVCFHNGVSVETGVQHMPAMV
jgi:diguanylate cyclase